MSVAGAGAPAWSAAEARDPAAVSAALAARGVSLEPDEVALLGELLGRPPSWAEAVLFGILGAFFLVAAVRPALQPLAFVVAFVSIVSFLWLAWSTGGYNARVGRVVTADVVALVCLAIAIVARMYAMSRG